MNKVKMFFVAAALVLTTAGVFAGKSKFAASTPPNLYYSTNGITYNLISTAALSGSANLAIFTSGTPSGSPARLQGATGPYTLYSDVSGTKFTIYNLQF
ncbi:MAG TPA: hypothetical protein VHD83_17455 [Puia sp.]|nr:hypothetical protein [Puia sp.]